MHYLKLPAYLHISCKSIFWTDWPHVSLSKIYKLNFLRNNEEFQKMYCIFKIEPMCFLKYIYYKLEIKPCGLDSLDSRIRDMEAESYSWYHFLVNDLITFYLFLLLVKRLAKRDPPLEFTNQRGSAFWFLQPTASRDNFYGYSGTNLDLKHIKAFPPWVFILWFGAQHLEKTCNSAGEITSARLLKVRVNNFQIFCLTFLSDNLQQNFQNKIFEWT